LSALLLIHKDGGAVTNIPFVYKDGQMMEAIESIADYIVGAGMVDSFWESAAAERLGIILRQQTEIRDLTKENAELKEWAAFISPVVKEAV